MKAKMLIVAVSAALLVSCNQEKLVPPTPNDQGVDYADATEIIIASIEGGTKAGFNYSSSEHSYSHFWESGDRIAFFPKNNSGQTYSCSNPNSGEFAKVSNSNDPVSFTYSYNYAVYPAGAPIGMGAQNDDEMKDLIMMDYDTSIPITSTGALNVEVPVGAYYAIDANTLGYGNIMIARSEDEHFVFKNCLGWLKIQLTGTATVKQIKITGNNGEILSGAGSVVFDGSGNPILTMDNDCDAASNDKILNINSPFYTLSASTPTPFYFPLPPVTFTKGLTVRVTYANSAYEEFSTSKSVTISRNNVTPMAAKEVSKSLLCTGVNFNHILKTLVAGADKTSSDEDALIKGIELSLGEISPAATSVNLADDGEAIYATFNAGSGLITLHTSAHTIRLNTLCSSMFERMTALESIDMLSQIAESNIGGGAISMFRDCSSLESVDLSRLNTSSVTSFANMFNGCSALKSLDLSTLNTSSATTFTYMFAGCSSLTSLDVSGFDTAKVTIFSDMFNGCASLAGIDFGASFFKNKYIRTLDAMFYNCSSLGSVNLTNNATASFETNSPFSTMADICYGCTSLTSFTITLPGRVTSFSEAFMNCSNLEVVDIDTMQDYNDPNYYQMFRGCRKMNTLKVSHWNCPTLSSGTTTSKNRYMFLETCEESSGLDIYISSSQFTWLGYYFNATMNASGFVTRHNPNL